MNPINDALTAGFIDGFYPPRGGALGALETQVRAEGLPVAHKDVIALLELICTTVKPKRVLEIGTCVGFSTLILRAACPQTARILTIDRYAYMIKRAKENFAAFNAENITLLQGQAAEILPTLSGPFDLIFLDAAKAQYPRFLPRCIELMGRDAVFIADNVLCGGIVAGHPTESRRDKTIVKRMNMFVEMVRADERLYAKTLLAAGDGVIIFKKR